MYIVIFLSRNYKRGQYDHATVAISLQRTNSRSQKSDTMFEALAQQRIAIGRL